MEWRRNKKVIYRKRDLRAHLFFNKRPLLQGRAISRQSQVCRVSQLSSLLRNRRRSPKAGRFDTSRTFADFFVGSVRTAPLGWCGYEVFKIWWAISEGDRPWFESCRSLSVRSRTICNPGVIFASLGTLSPVMGTNIDAPAHTSTRHPVKRARELRRGQPDAMKYAGLRYHRVHVILKYSPR